MAGARVAVSGVAELHLLCHARPQGVLLPIGRHGILDACECRKPRLSRLLTIDVLPDAYAYHLGSCCT